MTLLEKLLYKAITRQFKNVTKDKHGVKRIDLEDSILCYNPETGRLEKQDYYMPFFLNRDTIGFGTNKKVLKELLNELNKLG